jgi:Uma2 family endonuclease
MSASIPVVNTLEPGDHLDQSTFHECYEAMGDDVRAELVQGVVYMPSPAMADHARPCALLLTLLGLYESETPGVAVISDATTILDEENEVQPDGGLFILPEKGGRVRINDRGYLEGAPDWVGEIALSTASYDLHSKKTAYEQAGVQEYVVVAVRQARVFWFRLRNGVFVELEASSDGVFRSEVFPGLWLDPAALLQLNSRRLLEVLRQGTASTEHAAFVKRLRQPDAHTS